MAKLRPDIIGVLALQGDFAEHLEILRRLGAQATEVRTRGDLARVRGLIIPGGESTVMSNLMKTMGLTDAIRKRHAAGTLPIFGTCAGLILLARGITGTVKPRGLKLLDISVRRNAYGTQRESFAAKFKVKGIARAIRADFIRAPRITKVGKGVDVLARVGRDIVVVRQGDLLGSACHPEVRGDQALHRYFLSMIGEGRRRGQGR